MLTVRGNRSNILIKKLSNHDIVKSILVLASLLSRPRLDRDHTSSVNELDDKKKLLSKKTLLRVSRPEPIVFQEGPKMTSESARSGKVITSCLM